MNSEDNEYRSYSELPKEQKMLDDIMTLLDNVLELQERIDKAKTRISLIQMEDNTNKETREVLNDLLEILRGEDNE